MHGILVEKNSALAESLNKLEKKDYQLVEKELYYRTLFESAEDAIFIMDGDLFVECNPKTLEMFNCKREDIINQVPCKFSPEIQPDGRLIY